MAGGRPSSSMAGGCPYSDDRDRVAFIRELKQFHESRGSAFRSVPTINGRPVDLHMLYTQVTAQGGWIKVNDGHKWDNIMRLLRLPKRCSNAALAIKQVYLRFLDHYEKIHFHGEDPDDDAMDSSESRGRRSHGNMLQVPMTYNFHQHEVTDASRVHLGLSMDLQMPCEYNKLAMALHSCLPNEVDMAIRTCMRMSCEARRVLRLDKMPRLLDLLVAQTGIWSEGHESMRAVCEHNWRNVKGQDMGLFWDRTVDDAEVKELLAMPGRNELQDEDHFFNLADMASYLSLEGQRILQVSIVLRNLSFEECNVPVLASSPTSLKFLLLCAHCKWSNLRQTSLDTLGNIAPEIILDPIDDSIAQLIFRTVTKNLLSNDRFLIIRGLEMLAGVCQSEANRKTLSKSLESRVYEQICSLLTVQDIMLLIYALDCLYRLSALGKRACSAIAGIHRMMDILVNLLTLESQAYGQNACVRMKVIETCGLGGAQSSASPAKTHSGRTSAIQLQAGYQELDNETFASNWLKAYYEISQGRSVSQTDIYSDYQNNCIKLGKKGLVGPTQLSNYIRAVFPHVMPKRADGGGGGGSETYLEGIRRRTTPLPVSIFGPLKINSTAFATAAAGHHHHQNANHARGSRTSSSPVRPSSPVASGAAASNHSPILKAQLSAPPRSPVTQNQTHRAASSSGGCALNFTAPRTRPGQLSAMLGHNNDQSSPRQQQQQGPPQVKATTRLNGVQRAVVQMTVKVDAANHEESSNSSGGSSFASSLDGESRPPRPLSTGGGSVGGGVDLAASLREALHDKTKLRNGNSSCQQPVAASKHKGVLADLLEGKVHTDALLLMNGIVDKRKVVAAKDKEETPPLTNGDASHPVVQVRSCGTVTSTTTTTAACRNSEDLIGFPRVSIDQLNQIRQQEGGGGGKRPPVLVVTAAAKQQQPAKRARLEKQVPVKPSPATTGQVVAGQVAAGQDGGKDLEYICEWKGCKKSFGRAAQVFIHACKTHVRELSADLPCQWDNCDQMIRQKYSLMTHLQDRHCGEQVLHVHALRRRDIAKCGSSSIQLPPPPPPHPGYAPNAAVQAIRRHALEFVNPNEIAEEREGSVTKSVRLTAALTIRNVVLHSSTGRRLVKRYEEHLANIAVSNVESSRTIAQCLWELYRLSEDARTLVTEDKV